VNFGLDAARQKSREKERKELLHDAIVFLPKV